MHPSRTLALVGALGAYGCHDVTTPDFQTMYFDVDLEPGIEPCVGQLAAYDRFYERIFPVWAGHPPGHIRAHIQVLRDPHCTGIEQSCVQGHNAWLVGDIEEYHELAHVMHAMVDGWSAKWLNEGVAEAFGPATPFVFHAESISDVGPEFMFDADSDLVGRYGFAATWTRYLLEKYGSSTFRQYFVAMEAFESPSPADFRREFATAFGVSLDDEWDEFAAEARCPFDTWFCADRHPVDLPYELVGATCESDDWLGYQDTDAPDNRDFLPMKIVHVEVTQAETLSFKSSHARIDVGRCGDCSADLGEFGYGSEDEEMDVTLPATPGTYAIVIHARGQPDVTIDRAPQ